MATSTRCDLGMSDWILTGSQERQLLADTSTSGGFPERAEVQGQKENTLDDKALEKLVDDHKNLNTKRKTDSDLRIWYKWCSGIGEKGTLGELNRLLGHFFANIRKKDGSVYESDTLSSIHRSIDRHLTQDLHKVFSILRDPQFASSRQVLKASRKFLKAKGKGNKPNASEPVHIAELEHLWETGALGSKDPQTLQCTIWWLISTHIGTRGYDERHKFCFGDFTIKDSPDGSEYVEMMGERGTKTRSGETEKSTNADACAFHPKMWAIPQTLKRCPIALFRQFASRRSPEMCSPDSPFHLAVNHHRSAHSFWYKRSRLGIHSIDLMMKRIATAGELSGRKTNHSDRKIMVTTLCQNNTPDSVVMQLTGHKSVQSLNHYKVPSLRQQENLSHILSNCSPPPFSDLHLSSTHSTTPQVPLAPVQQQSSSLHLNRKTSTWSTNSTIQGLLTEATFSSCTINFNFGQHRSEKPCHIKRPRVLYSDSDSD